jgi:hypothetical protein
MNTNTNTNTNTNNYNIINNNNMNNNKSSIIHVQSTKKMEDIDIDSELINNLQNYMFTTKNLSKFTKLQNYNHEDKSTKKINSKNNNYQYNKEIPIIKKKQDTFVSDLKDNLFWCFYVIKMGIEKYDMIGNQHFVIEKEMKFKYIELLRSKKDLLKINKIKPLYELEDDLANKPQISLKTFVALCIIENINICIINKKKIFEFIYNDENLIFIIKRAEDSLKFILELNNIKITDEKIKEYRNNYYQLNNIDSSIKSMASYKLDELNIIANKLGINIISENNKKKTKKEIYETILLNF